MTRTARRGATTDASAGTRRLAAIRAAFPQRALDVAPPGAGQDQPAMVPGVTAAGIELVMPIDRALRWVRLTREQRERLRRAAELD